MVILFFILLFCVQCVLFNESKSKMKKTKTYREAYCSSERNTENRQLVI